MPSYATRNELPTTSASSSRLVNRLRRRTIPRVLRHPHPGLAERVVILLEPHRRIAPVADERLLMRYFRRAVTRRLMAQLVIRLLVGAVIVRRMRGLVGRLVVDLRRCSVQRPRRLTVRVHRLQQVWTVLLRLDDDARVTGWRLYRVNVMGDSSLTGHVPRMTIRVATDHRMLHYIRLGETQVVVAEAEIQKGSCFTGFRTGSGPDDIVPVRKLLLLMMMILMRMMLRRREYRRNRVMTYRAREMRLRGCGATAGTR